MTDLPVSDADEHSDADKHVVAFRRLLSDCERLYREAAEETIRSQPQAMARPAPEFLELMLDLQRGLVIKIFVEIAQSDWNWSPGERDLAVELMAHVWGTRLVGDEIRDALETLVEQSGKLTWSALLSPFERLPSFREQVSKLETIVSRLANLVAKFDGQAGPQEINRIRHIQSELRRLLVPIDLDAADDPSPDANAVKKIFLSGGDFRREAPPVPGTSAPSKPRPELLAETLAELDSLVGVTLIKHDVQELVNLLKFHEQRKAHGLSRTPMSLHMVFCGNPGTGKTTIARLIGRVFGSLGILSRGHLVETDRSGLVAGYVGQTGAKTNKKIDEALDGVLFIDEAYSLVAEQTEDAYGAEAIQALIKRMEDDRERLVVVLAGYPRPMEAMLASNPGLSSRFNRRFDFPDYTAVELGQIFERLCGQQDYVLPPATRVRLLVGFRHLLLHRDERFGNGRLARNIFEASIRRLATRVAATKELTKELLTHLEPADIVMEGVPVGVWSEDAERPWRVAVACPGCQKLSRCSTDFLGRQVRCNRCGREFTADWGELVE